MFHSTENVCGFEGKTGVVRRTSLLASNRKITESGKYFTSTKKSGS